MKQRSDTGNSFEERAEPARLPTTESATRCRSHLLRDLLRQFETDRAERLTTSTCFTRTRVELDGRGTLLRDAFPDGEGASCLFVRLAPAGSGVEEFAVDGSPILVSCECGGWLLESRDDAHPSYWIPQPPMLRTFDSLGRILLEMPASIAGIRVSGDGMALQVATEDEFYLEWVVWVIPPASRGLCAELVTASSLERTKTFLWSSKTTYALAAELYLYLIHGFVYQLARAWPRRWKFCCELDAYELYVWLSGLERATGKRLYGLLRRQIVCSVIARQSGDGGWYHGEWTDMNESHFRFHNGGVLLLESALSEWDDAVIKASLARGVQFVASHTDTTAFGVWFLHDTLEGSAELMDEMYRQTGSVVKKFGAWVPSRTLGKSPPNKMILNTHIDTTVALHRYRRLTGDERYSVQVDSARAATRALLELRPLEWVYRIAYSGVRMVLLPASEAGRMPLLIRAVRRLLREYLLPNLFRLKRAFPRVVMPGGFVDRHLSHIHFDGNYHAVNVVDLARLWRQFPEEKLEPVLNDAVRWVVGGERAVLRWWSEVPPRRFAVVAFAEALYHLCMLRRSPDDRRYLAETMMQVEDLGLGLPPSLLGGNAEIIPSALQVACPSPTNRRLRIANLSTPERQEWLVVNPTQEECLIEWEAHPPRGALWTRGDGSVVALSEFPLRVAARSWLIGVDSSPTPNAATSSGMISPAFAIHEYSQAPTQ